MASQDQIIYAAGFFDGEGSVTLAKPNSSYPNYVLLRVDIGQTSKPVLDWFQEVWGGAIHYRNANRGRSVKENWQWYISGVRAQVFLIDVLPYLKVKQDSVTIKLATWLERPNQSPNISSAMEQRVLEHPLSTGDTGLETPNCSASYPS